MALEKTVIEVRPGGGLRQDIAKWIPVRTDVLKGNPVPMQVLDNMLYRRFGAVEKRPGFGAMTTNVLISGAWDALYSAEGTPAGELLAIGNRPQATMSNPGDPGIGLWSYSTKDNQWVTKTHLPGLVMDRYPGIRGQQDIGDNIPMLCRIGTLECIAYSIGTTAYARIVDRATGAVLLDNTELTSSGFTGRVAVFNCGDAKFTFVYIRNGDELWTTKVDPLTLAGTSALVKTYPANVTVWDVVPTVSSHWCVAAVLAGVVPTDIVVDRVNNATQASVATVTEAAEGDNTISLGYRFGHTGLLMAWENRSNVRAKTYVQTTLATDLAAFNVVSSALWTYALRAVTCNYDNQNRLFILVAGEITLYEYGTWYYAYEDDGTPMAGDILAYWNLPQSKPFRTERGLMVPLARWYDTPQGIDFGGRYGTCFVNLNRHPNLINVSTSSARPAVVEAVVGVADSLGFPREAVEQSLPWVQTRSGGEECFVPFLIAGAGSVLQKNPRTWVDVAEIATDVQAGGQWTAAYASRLTHFSGSLLTQYDGQSAVEAAWLEPPQYHLGTVDIDYELTGLEGATPTPNRYTYLFIWEWIDAQGQVHRSRLSEPLQVDVATDGVFTRGQITFEVRNTSLSRRGDPTDGADNRFRLAIFRTLANGTVFYRLAFNDEYNDPRVPTFSIEDIEDDAALVAALRGSIYTAGGVLENETPPPAKHVQVGGGRVWITSAELPEVWPSSELISGEAPAWSSVTRITMDDAQTPLVATAIMDGALIIFSESRIYTVPTQSGPGPTGLPSWPRPEEVQSSTGCISSRSVVPFQDGVAYQDSDGIKLLTRGRQIVDLGAPVRDLVAEYPVVADAKLDAVNERIYWLMEGNGGRILMYDYRHQSWSSWSTTEDFSASRLTTWRGELVTPQANILYRTLQSTTTPGYDELSGSPNWIPSTVETPWIMLGALGGYQRVWRAVLELEKLSNHGMTLKVFVDGEETTPAQTEVFTEAQISALQGLPRQRLLVGIAPQKCQSIKLRIEDSAPTVDVAESTTGHRYYGLSLEIGQKYGAEKAEKANTR